MRHVVGYAASPQPRVLLGKSNTCRIRRSNTPKTHRGRTKADPPHKNGRRQAFERDEDRRPAYTETACHARRELCRPAAAASQQRGPGLSLELSLLIAHHLMVAVLHHDVVGAALDDRGGAHEREARLLLQLLDGLGAAVAHRGLDLVDRLAHALLERAGVGPSLSEPA